MHATEPRKRAAPRRALVAASILALAAGGTAFGFWAWSRFGVPSDPVEIWTDVPEMALVAERFNASQDRFVVDLRYEADLSGALREARRAPSLAVGRFLKSSQVRDRFQSLDYLFGELAVNQAAFYPSLLALGNIDGRQLLLPVSFNLPALVFLREGVGRAAAPSAPAPAAARTAGAAGTARQASAQPASPPGASVSPLAELELDFLLSMEDLARLAPTFNLKQKESYVRMGFSPRWDPDFLCIVASSEGASFREGKPLGFDEQGLRRAVDGLREWSATANGGGEAEDDYQFKYLYTPPYTYLAERRALFAYMRSDEYFLVPEEKRAGLDFRWFEAKGAVPIDEGIVYAAILRKGRNKAGAEAFLSHLFREESQESLLAASRATRAMESFFGVAGGFSALRAVNEKAFPAYYPGLVGRLPPADALSAPNILPGDWPLIKSEVLGPWLVDASGKAPGAAFEPARELGRRIAEFYEKQAAAR